MDLKIKDVADLLNISETTVRRWLLKGKIPAYRLNNSEYRFNRIEIEDWVMNQKEKNNENSDDKKVAGGTGGNKQYSLYRALHKGVVLHNVPGNFKEEIICNTMNSVSKELNLDAEVLSELLLERESLQPTALNNGIGIPHTRDFLLNAHHDIVVLASPEKPIAYGALDGKRVHSLFFLFACEGKRHLHLLAKIAHLCSQPATLELLRSKPSKEVFLEYIKEWESKITQAAEEV